MPILALQGLEIERLRCEDPVAIMVFFIKGKYVKGKTTAVVGMLAAMLASPVLMADSATSPAMTDAQKQAIEKVVHDYLVSHPEVLIEASQALRQKEQLTAQAKAQEAILANAPKLFTDTLTVTGNPKGQVTLVEFFDYQCIHCKKMAPVIASLVKKDGNLRVIYKEFPIFGESSDEASRAALAAGMQGKYQAMHEALFKIDERLDSKLIENAAKSAGVDVARMKKDMSSDAVTKALAANRELAEKLHLMGTPALIIGATPNGAFKTGTQPTFIPGAAGEDSLQKMIAEASKG